MTDSFRRWETTDMSLAAWMLAQKKTLAAVHRLSANGRDFRFVFDDDGQDCDSLALDFINSDAHSYDVAMRGLKKMLFGPSGIVNAVASRYKPRH